MVRHALLARNKMQHNPVADEWTRNHVEMKFAARKRRSLITMCRDFAACFDNEAVPPASVLQISLCLPCPVLVRRASAFLLPVLRRHELGAPRRATLRLCSAACRPSCSSTVCSGAGLCLSTPSGTVLLSPPSSLSLLATTRLGTCSPHLNSTKGGSGQVLAMRVRQCPVTPGVTGHARATPAPRPRHPSPKMAYSPRHARAMPAPRPRQCPVTPGNQD
eukprot:gene9288-biopygen4694